MSKRLSGFYYMMVAFAFANMVSMFYATTEAYAAFTCQNYVNSTLYAFSYNCYHGGYQTASYQLDFENGNYYSGYHSGPDCLYGSYACSSIPIPYGETWANYTGYIYGGVGSAYGSCYVSTSYIPTPDYYTYGCGTSTYCGDSKVAVNCNTGSSAGYLSVYSNYGYTYSSCICCPDPGVGVAAAPAGATAAYQCYVVGNFEDSTGLFEYTDADRCGYPS